MNSNLPNPMLDIKVPGADTKDVQIHLYTFCEDFHKGNPTDAAYQLMRNLTLLASRTQNARAKKVVTSIVSHLPRSFKDE